MTPARPISTAAPISSQGEAGCSTVGAGWLASVFSEIPGSKIALPGLPEDAFATSAGVGWLDAGAGVPGVGAFETGVGAGEGAWATGTEGTDAEASSTAAWGVCVESTVAARSDWVAAGETTVSGDAEDVASTDGGGAEGIALGPPGWAYW